MKRENNDGVFNLTVFKWKGNRNRNEKYPTIMDKLSDLYYFIGKEEEWWKAKIMMVFYLFWGRWSKWKRKRNKNEEYPTIMDELSGLYYFIGKEEKLWKEEVMIVFSIYSEAGKVCGKGKEMIEMQWWTDGQFIIFIGNEAEECKKIIKIVLIDSEAYKNSNSLWGI